MPLLGFSKQRLNPNRAFTHSLLISRGCLISRYPVKVLLVKGALDYTSIGAGCTFGLNGTAFTCFSWSAVNEGLVMPVNARKRQALFLGTNVTILLSVIRELLNWVDLGAQTVVSSSKISTNTICL